MYYWQKSSYSCFCPLEERKRVEIGVPQLRTSFVQVMAFDIRAINWFSIYFAAKRAMNEAKLKCWNGFPKFLELRQHLGCVISQLTREDGTATEELSGVFWLLFHELFSLTPSSELLSILSIPTEDTRRPKLKAWEIEQVFYQQAPYKAPDNIKTIAISKT